MSDKIEELFEDLTLEETTKLVGQLDDITMDEEIGKRILDMSLEKVGIDPEKVTVIPKKKRYHRWTKVAASIAAVLVVCSASAYASGAFEKMSVYFTGEVDQYKKQLQDTMQTSENSKYKVEVQGTMADKNQCLFILTINEKLEDGKDNSLTWDLLDETRYVSVYAKMKDGTKRKVNRLGSGGGGDRNICVYRMSRQELQIESMELVEEFEVHYRDIIVNAKVVVNGETIPLYGKAKSPLKQVEMSPIGFRFSTKANYIEGASNEHVSDIKLIKKDGTIEKLEEWCMEWPTDDSRPDDIWVQGDYCGKIIAVEEYQGLQIDGVKYYRK